MTFEEWYGSDLTGKTYNGTLSCAGRGLTSLKGCPKIVTGSFYCARNRLTSLEHCPEIVHRIFMCSSNYLTTLEHGPKFVGDSYYCEQIKLDSLNGLCYAKRILSEWPDEMVQDYLIEHYPEQFI